MIPKIIHYVWVGKAPKPELVKKCIESWKKHCPDYQIMEWNDEILKEIDNQYVKEAYEYKKWAFVSDYLRLYALKKYGGFYCDTDLEITQNIDEFRKYRFVSCYENCHGVYYPIVTAFMGAEKDNNIIQDLLAEYKDIPFVTNGMFDQTTNTVRVAKYFQKKFGINKPYDGTRTTVLEEGAVLYPSYYFCVPEENKVNYCIHHFDESWSDAYIRRVIFSFKGYRLLRFKRHKNKRAGGFCLLNDERLILKLRLSPRKIICLVGKNKSAS